MFSHFFPFSFFPFLFLITTHIFVFLFVGARPFIARNSSLYECRVDIDWPDRYIYVFAYFIRGILFFFFFLSLFLCHSVCGLLLTRKAGLDCGRYPITPRCTTITLTFRKTTAVGKPLSITTGQPSSKFPFLFGLLIYIQRYTHKANIYIYAVYSAHSSRLHRGCIYRLHAFLFCFVLSFFLLSLHDLYASYITWTVVCIGCFTSRFGRLLVYQHLYTHTSYHTTYMHRNINKFMKGYDETVESAKKRNERQMEL